MNYEDRNNEGAQGMDIETMEKQSESCRHLFIWAILVKLFFKLTCTVSIDSISLSIDSLWSFILWI